jgi:hypothetical protein
MVVLLLDAVVNLKLTLSIALVFKATGQRMTLLYRDRLPVGRSLKILSL